MKNAQTSTVIYGEGPFIEDMGLLTTLCLLHDEVLLFGSKSLGEHFEEYWAKSEHASNSMSTSVVEQVFQTLQPEGVVSFFSPSDAASRFPGIDNIELPGIERIEKLEKDGEQSVALKIDTAKTNELSKLVIRGTKAGQRTVSDLIRDVSLLAVAFRFSIPIVSESSHIAVAPSSTRVSEVAAFLAHKTLRRLALPELRAYHAEDILEARQKLKGELEEFKAATLELVWLLHQRTGLDGDLHALTRECDILIDTKIASALLLLEKAFKTHQSKRIRRILRATGGALLELGKSLITPNAVSVLMGGGSALLRLSESLDTQPPSNQIASFVYKLRGKDF